MSHCRPCSPFDAGAFRFRAHNGPISRQDVAYFSRLIVASANLPRDAMLPRIVGHAGHAHERDEALLRRFQTDYFTRPTALRQRPGRRRRQFSAARTSTLSGRARCYADIFIHAFAATTFSISRLSLGSAPHCDYQRNTRCAHTISPSIHVTMHR